MVGVSRRRMDSKASCPSPGQLKTVSTMIAPESRYPICSPAIVTTGSTALRRACFQMTLRSGSPLARAVRM